MDRYFQSSQIAFYDSDGDAVANTAGRGLFGLDSLMYGRWFSPAAEKGLYCSLVGGLTSFPVDLSAHFHKLGPIQQQSIYKNGTRVAHFHYRVGYSYRAR
jgi:hypothetical protein